MSALQPTQIVDKNGKHTTVYRSSVDESAGSKSRIATITPKQSKKPEGTIAPVITDLGETVPTPLPYNPNKSELYDPVVFQHYDGDNPIPLAPIGYTGAKCPKCFCYLTKEELRTGQQGSSITCPNCNAQNSDRDYGDFFVALASDAIPLLNSENVRQGSWFHATTRKDWVNEVANADDQPILHFGSLDAAIARAKAVAEEAETPEFIIHELRIKPGVEITPAVLVDADNLAPNFVSDFPDYDDAEGDSDSYSDTFSATGIGRYVNGFEDHGSISLASVLSNFDVVASKPFAVENIDEAREAFVS
jgi:hypothetical protein